MVERLTEDQVKREATEYLDQLERENKNYLFYDPYQEEKHLAEKRLGRLSPTDRRRVQQEALNQQIDDVRYRTPEEREERKAEISRRRGNESREKFFSKLPFLLRKPRYPSPSQVDNGMTPTQYAQTHGRLKPLRHGPGGGTDYLNGNQPAGPADRRPRVYEHGDPNAPINAPRWADPRGFGRGVKRPGPIPGGGGGK